MNPTPVFELAELLGGVAKGFGSHVSATGWATDSRHVKPGDLFLAIKGANVDGHDHAAEAINLGAIGVIAERTVDAPHILVSNLPVALARMASAYRDRFTGPVIGVTGSAGKTMTRGVCGCRCEALGAVLKTEGNQEHGIHGAAALPDRIDAQSIRLSWSRWECAVSATSATCPSFQGRYDRRNSEHWRQSHGVSR